MIRPVAKKSEDLVVEVVHPDNDESVDEAEFMDEQNRALMNYRLTGEAGVYIDPTRDQEPDIAPELGVAPHPDLANPAPPKSSFSGRALDPGSNSMVLPADEKEENAKEATEAFNEALAEREEKLANLSAASDFPAGAQPVYIVEKEEALEGVPALPADESPKAVNQSGEQLGQDLSGAQDSASDSDSDSDKSDNKKS